MSTSDHKPVHNQISPQVLNPAQYTAVTHGNGPVLVIAGAGSGKTRTLVYRLAYLLQQGVRPDAILLLTFTRRAAQEMLHRAATISAQSCHRIVGGTFHGTANMLLRQYGYHIGIRSRFTIIDRADAEGIINLMKSSLGLSGAGKRFPSKRVIMNILSGSINKSRSIDDLVYEGHIHLSEFIEDLYAIRAHYQQFKADHALMDYDDLLVNWERLLRESAEARREIRHRFEHILVDEYQDTNLLQASIIKLLSPKDTNIMVVGDDAQSIYSFRGADFSNIMRFSDQFSGTKIVTLEENYRSTQPILELANSILRNAEEKFAKNLFTSIQGGSRPRLYVAPNESTEARYVVETIEQLVAQGNTPDTIAVLFRSGFHSYKLEIELAGKNLSFEKRGGMKLTESAHIKDILSFFRILVNPWDALSWNRVLLHLDKVGPKTSQKIINTILTADDPINALSSYIPGKSWKDAFDALIETLQAIDHSPLPPSALFDKVYEYYLPIFEKIYYDDYPKRIKDLEQLKIVISGYGDLQSFVDDTSLDPPENETAPAQDVEQKKVILSTIHSAKGLEWDVVFILGLASGRFPHQNATPGPQWEEERRLLYVAVTRAKKELYMTYPRELYGADRKRYSCGMSPFLNELPVGLYEKIAPQVHSTPLCTPGIPQPSSGLPAKKAASARQTFEPGLRVHHAYFGTGTVLTIPGPRKLEVAFDRHGNKILHLDYANLEPLN
ncbi:MAG: DNA helicase UvrD [Desulfobulbus propionicus]|nr:MAG: DNA helicase UvrD [Desulfobulbus propionicus]